jgi:molybdopterin-binding protein
MRFAHMQRRIDSFPSREHGASMAAPQQQGRPMSISAINVRNQFRGTIKEVIEGPVVSGVDVETAGGLIVTSVITTRSVKELGLAPGKAVVALVKSTEVSIATL